ncbi:MAG TPA: cysteine desulfurase family protein [Deltaproteobacteria bacterium]|nr:cysteine desulfurase family protein [Deltaproteobacteria bacterium]HPR52585.1 cysteine desulfurase family protein [Deltaproteobacteria bacterium]
MTQPIYLDYNATTPHDPEVIDAMREYLEREFGNPSSTHWYGIAPKRAVDKAREQVAALINCSPGEIIFTGCATESNNHAIKGIIRAFHERGNHIITSVIEHPAVLEVCAFLESTGCEVTYVPVDDTGLVDTAAIERAICPSTILITIMHANNEVGTIQNIEEVASVARSRSIVMHTDAAQSLGKIPVDVKTLGVDLLSIAGHKLYAPKGIGALYVRDGIDLAPFMHGAGQEGGRRAGTENVVGIVGLGKACEIAQRDLERNMEHMKQMRDRFFEGILEQVDRVRLNGDINKRLPNTLSLSFEGLEANRILEEIGLKIAASAGAACHSDTVKISHVLEAMGVPMQWAKGTLRLSTGRYTTEDEIEQAITGIASAIKTLKKRA